MSMTSLNTFYGFLWSIVIFYPLVFLFLNRQINIYSSFKKNFISINLFLIQAFCFSIWLFSAFLCVKFNLNFLDIQEELVRYVWFSLCGYLFFYFFGKTTFIKQWLLTNTLMRISFFISFLYVLLGVVFWNLSAEEFNHCLCSILEFFYTKIVNVNFQDLSEDVLGYYFLYYFFYIFKIFFSLFVDKTLVESLSYLTLSSILFDILFFYLPNIETASVNAEIATMMFKITQKSSAKFSVAFRNDVAVLPRKFTSVLSIKSPLEILNTESFKNTSKFFQKAPITETTVAQKVFAFMLLDEYKNTNDMRESFKRILHVVSEHNYNEEKRVITAIGKFCPKLVNDIIFIDKKPFVKFIYDPSIYLNGTDISFLKEAKSFLKEVASDVGEREFKQISTMHTVYADALLNHKKLHLPVSLREPYDSYQVSYLLPTLISMHLDNGKLSFEVLFYDKAQGLYNNHQMLIKCREVASMLPVRNHLGKLTGKNLSVFLAAQDHCGDYVVTTPEGKKIADTLAGNTRVQKNFLLNSELAYPVDTVDSSFSMVNISLSDSLVDKESALATRCFQDISYKILGKNHPEVNINVNIPNSNASPEVLLKKIKEMANDSEHAAEFSQKISKNQIFVTTADS